MIMNLLLSCIVLVCALPRGAQAQGQDHFVGFVRSERATARLELELGAEDATVDFPDGWSLGIRAESRAENELVTVSVPGLGSLELVETDDGLEGELVFGTSRAAVHLVRQPAIPVRLVPMRFSGGGIELAGTLGLPGGAGPHGALVLVPGGGDSMRSQASTRFLTEYLPRFGIACLVYDKRGSGESSGNWRQAGIGELAADALAAVTALRQRQDIHPEAIGFFAASQGTWVALEALAREPQAVAFLVNHSGPAVPLLEADTFALRSSAIAAGLDTAAQEEVLGLWKLECEALRLGVAPPRHAPLVEAIARARARPWFARLPYEATSADSWWLGWYPRVMEHDPRAALESLRIPTLWLYGSADTQSEVAANLARLGALAPGRPWTVHLFPGGDHGVSVPLFDETDGPRAMAEGYFELLVAWLTRQLER
jgi:hypothetical protein